MTFNVTPKALPGRQVIQGYGDGGFRIAGQRHEGSVLVLAEETLAWSVDDACAISSETLAPLLRRAPLPRILIIGCGKRFVAMPAGLAMDLRRRDIGLEWMDTGAACRTFNVLLLEERPVAAALIAV